jgi:hypothetical protein
MATSRVVLVALVASIGCGGAPTIVAPATRAAPRPEPRDCDEEPRAEGDPDAEVALLRAFASRCDGTAQAADAMLRVGGVEAERGHAEATIDAYLRAVCPRPVPPTELRTVELGTIAECRPPFEQPLVAAMTWSSIGEIYFEQADTPRALASFEAGLRFPSPTMAN